MKKASSFLWPFFVIVGWVRSLIMMVKARPFQRAIRYFRTAKYINPGRGRRIIFNLPGVIRTHHVQSYPEYIDVTMKDGTELCAYNSGTLKKDNWICLVREIAAWNYGVEV